MAININSSQTSDNINQYVILCKIGYWEYFENVCQNYKPYINYLANKYFYKDGDNEDLIQQGLIGLYYAIQRFDPNKNKQFDSFARLCIRKSIFQIIRGSNAKKQTVHTNSVFLFDLIEDDFIILDTIINKDAMLPEDILIRKEEKTEIQNLIKKNLSVLERNVFNLYIKGYSSKDIAKELEVSYKSVDNALARIRRKMKSKKKLLRR